MMTVHLLSMLLCIPGFAALALAMERHQEDVFKAALSPATTRLVRVAGWALLLLALLLLVRTRGWSLGLIAYSGHTSFAAGVVFVALVGLERWRLRRQPPRGAR